ncbi:hypothetical protein Nepgr_025256 [Nepenthes gracilis]|uniref:BAT2 N-terminal domain-containing protein n=1 Tax=Nepenthes gracilis TaxID=150966 RepID=A0AAD3XZI3_NEPGR|nr:hypothetical protein Nepgr_025256 [Nepenthes gracilis]
MASSMISGDRRRAMRRGGMTVLGKVAVPKPINLPSQRLENHGLDLNVEIVPKGTLGWGSRPSSAGSNAWGTSVLSPRTDGSSVSPSHLSGRPSSGGGSRPSTAGSEKGQDSANAWGSNSRPSSASGALTSNHISLRPRSAETRPGSSQLSRFAEPLTESSVPWGATGTAEKLGAESSANDGFSLSSGDFPTLGSEKDNSGKNTESQDCGSNSRPRSSSARLSSVAERTTISPGDDVSRHPDGKSGLANSWGRDNHYENGPWSGMERWHGDPHPFPNPNLRPHHYESWNGAPGVNPPVGVWYRGPPATPYGAPVAPGGFSMEPFPYYCPPVSAPGLANSQPVQHPGAGPHGHRPKSGDMYGPRIPDSFIRPAMHIRPGFYPGPVPYEGYYGPPPMGFCNPNEQDFPYMGMAAVGPHAYNRYPNHNAADINNSQAKSCEGTTPEKLESGPVDDSRGHSKVLVKENHSWDRDDGEGKWGNKVRSNSSNHDKGDFLKSSAEEDAWGYDHKEEEMSYRKIAHRNDSSSPSFEDKVGCINPGNVKFADMNPVIENVAPPRDHTLIQKIEGLNAKARASDVRHGLASSFCADEPHNRVQVVEAKPSRPTDEAVVGMVHLERHHPSGVLVPVSCDTGILMGDKSIEAAVAIRTTVPRRATQGVQIQGDHHLRGKFNNLEADGWRKKNAASEFPSASLETTTEVQVQVCPVVPPSNETSKSYIEGKDDVALPALIIVIARYAVLRVCNHVKCVSC